MKVSDMRFFDQGVAKIQDANARLADLQRKISTGEAVNRPSDAPGVTARIHRVEALQERQAAYARAIDLANNRLQLQETNLQGVSDSLLKIKDLAIQGSNETLGDSDREAVSLEIKRLTEGLLDIANATDEFGNHIFAGSATRGPAFVERLDEETGETRVAYTGDNSSVQVDVGDGRSIRMTLPGTEAFRAIDDPQNEGERINFFAVLERLTTALDEGDVETVREGLDSVEALIEGISIARSDLGTAQSVLELQGDFLDIERVRSAELLSNLKDLDYAEALSELRKEEILLQAAQSTLARIGNLSLFNYIN